MRKTVFAGNGMSRTAMVFKIAAMGGVKLTIPQLNKIKEINPRSLERVYDEVLRNKDEGNARFALSLFFSNK
jgi:hypothetical protein